MTRQNILIILDYKLSVADLVEEIENEITAFLQSDASNYHYACLDLYMERFSHWESADSFTEISNRYGYLDDPQVMLGRMAKSDQSFSTLHITDGDLISDSVFGYAYLNSLKEIVDSGRSLHSLYIGDKDPIKEETPGILTLSEYAPVKCLPSYSRQKGEIKDWIIECVMSTEE